jgi:hypothetical protein
MGLRMWSEFECPVAVSCDDCNAHCCSINGVECLDQQSSCQLHKRDYAAWSHISEFYYHKHFQNATLNVANIAPPQKFA